MTGHPWLTIGAVLFYVLLSSGVVVAAEEAAGPPAKWDRPLMFIFWPALIVVVALGCIGRLMWEITVEGRR